MRGPLPHAVGWRLLALLPLGFAAGVLPQALAGGLVLYLASFLFL